MERKDAMTRAARLCSRQERCSHDIIRKLQQWEVSENDIEAVLSWLKKEKYLDDSRYANFYVQDKFRFNQWGKIKIRHVLKQKHLSEETITEALQQIPNDLYKKTCRELIENKLRTLKERNHFTRKAKIFRFASQRGFEPEIIYGIIGEWGE
jgi:regulatory protein